MREMLLLYFPSLLIRYSVHLLTIVLPWIMQMQNKKLHMIADNFSFYFLGCMLGCVGFYRYIRLFRMSDALKVCFALQMFLFIGAFFVQEPWLLNSIRFMHGIVLGVFRPANQIWVNEFEGGLTKMQLAQRATYSKLMVSTGLLLAGWVGALAPYAFHTSAFAVSYLLLFFGLPTSIMFYFFFWQDPFKDRKVHVTTQPIGEPVLSFRMLMAWILARPKMVFCMLIYAVSMFAFSAWFLFVPYELRSNANRFTGGKISSLLTYFLTGHSIIFSLTQYVVAKNLRYFKAKSNVQLFMMILGLCGQAVFIWFGLVFIKNVWLLFAFLLFGASFLAATVYPILMYVFFHEVKDAQSELMRKLIIVLSFSSDVGQFFGSCLLGASFLPPFLQGVNSILVPIYLCAFVLLIMVAFFSQKKISKFFGQRLDPKSEASRFI